MIRFISPDEDAGRPGLLNLALVVMREADVPEYQPDYTVPLYPAVPLLGAIASFGLIAFMNGIEILLSLLFVVAGVARFYVYVRGQTEKQGVFGSYILQEPEEWPEPAVATAEAVRPDASRYRVVVPLANSEHETGLITLASSLARQHENGVVVAVRVVEVPYQVLLEAGMRHMDDLDAESTELLAAARADTETLGVDVETYTILARDAYPTIFDAAETQNADVVVLGRTRRHRPTADGRENARSLAPSLQWSPREQSLTEHAPGGGRCFRL